MTRETTRKYLIKIVKNWLDKSINEKGVNESELELMFVLTHDFKSIVRCDSCKRFTIKCKIMTQDDNDPCF